MIIKPIRNMILVEKAAAKKTTDSGIIIQSAKATVEKTVLARVIEAGPGDYNPKGEFVPTCVKAGEYVVVFAEAGEELKFAGPGVFIITAQDVIAVVED